MLKDMKTYLVKNMADNNQPQQQQAHSKRQAAKLFVGRHSDPNWTIGVWTEKEWKNREAATEYRDYELH